MISLDEFDSNWAQSDHPDAHQYAFRLAVQEALRQLPPDYRTVLMMRDVDDMTNTEAAQAIGRSPSATKSLHFRARQALRDLLATALDMEAP